MATQSAHQDHPNPGHGKKSRVLDVVSVALLCVALSFAAYIFVPEVGLAFIVVAGKSPVCTWNDALGAEATGLKFRLSFENFSANSRVVDKDPAGIWLWDTPRGKYWVPAGEDQSLPRLLAEQEMEIYGKAGNGVRPGDIVLDCGAHVGSFTREALAAGAKLVVAVEPAPMTLVALKRNHAKDIAQGRVVVYEKGVWDRESTLPFQVGSEDANVGRVFPEARVGGNVIEIPLTTIDKVVEELELPRVDFIKMDIEGSERKALAGAAQTLAKYKPRMSIASYHLEDDQFKIPELVQAANSDYEFVCGPCGKQDEWIMPLTLFFH